MLSNGVWVSNDGDNFLILNTRLCALSRTSLSTLVEKFLLASFYGVSAEPVGAYSSSGVETTASKRTTQSNISPWHKRSAKRAFLIMANLSESQTNSAL